MEGQEDRASIEGKFGEYQPDPYVYGLAEPGDDRIFYVGVTTNPRTRLIVHWRDRLTPTDPKSQWLASLAARRMKPRLLILEKVDHDQRFRAEKQWIARLLQEGHPLTNSEAWQDSGYTPPTTLRPPRPADFPQVAGLWSVKQAADSKGLSTTAIYRAMQAGELGLWRVGDILVLFQWEVEAWTPPRRGPKPRRRPRKPPEEEPG